MFFGTNTLNESKEVAIKRKRKLRLWWFMLLPFFFVAIVILQLIGPSPRLRLGPDTTVITEPLNDRGVPNYSEYVLSKGRDGVTNNNNAAVLMWTAMWPGELGPEEQQLLLGGLQMLQPDPDLKVMSIYDESLLKQIENRYRADLAKSDDDPFLDFEFEMNVIAQAQERAWEPGELPFVETWAKENQAGLDLLIEAAARPKYFSPPPNLTENQPLLFSMLLPDVQLMREVVSTLKLRAMYDLSHGRYEEAWNSIHACYRFSRHCGRSQFSLIHVLVSYSIEADTAPALLSLISNDLPTELLRRIAADYDRLPPIAKHEIRLWRIRTPHDNRHPRCHFAGKKRRGHARGDGRWDGRRGYRSIAGHAGTRSLRLESGATRSQPSL